MVGLEAITEVTEKRPQLQGTAQELARKRRRGKPREAARRCWIVPFFDSPAEVRSAPHPTPAPNPPLLLPRKFRVQCSDLLPPLPPIFLTARFVSSPVRRRAPGPESSLLGDRRRPLIRRPLLVLDCRGVEIGLNQLFV